MRQHSQHVLVVDDDPLYQPLYEMLTQRVGRWPTFARNGDEALAILRSTSHPLSLLANQDYAVTHAFIVCANRGRDNVGDVDALREEIARLIVGFVAWPETPPGLEVAVAALDNTEEYLTSRG